MISCWTLYLVNDTSFRPVLSINIPQYIAIFFCVLHKAGTDCQILQAHCVNIKAIPANDKVGQIKARIEGKEMDRMSGNNTSNQLVNPAAREAMDKFKMEAAAEVGVNLKNGYNGELTSRQAGSVGGQMVRKMIEAYENGMK